MNEAHDTGLRERIAKAGSPEEIKELLDLGSTYTQADERTRRAWRNTAAKRLDELTGGGDAIQKEVKSQPNMTVNEMSSVIGTVIDVIKKNGVKD